MKQFARNAIIHCRPVNSATPKNGSWISSRSVSSGSKKLKSQAEHDISGGKSDDKLVKPVRIAKTIAQLDEEMRRAMEGRAGDGGEAGMELEDGKPVSMKRGVRENMFRYI